MVKAVTSIATGEGRPTPWLARLRLLFDLRYLALVTSVATYALIVLGGTVRATDSGLACPDWPRCHGQLIPPLDTHVLIEYSHRLAAMTVGFLILGTAVSAWLWYRNNRLLRGGATLALLLLIAQVLVGGVTVNMELPDTVVALHLAIALSLLASLLFTTVGAFRWGSSRMSDGPARAARGLLALPLVAGVAALGLILTGSYVANSGAGLVYPDWPLFNGKLVSAGGWLADLHYVHRLMAVVVGLLVLAVLVQAWRRGRSSLVKTAAGLALALYVAQVFVGASNIWFELATSVRILHLALASALWAALVLAASGAYFERRIA